MDVSSGTSINPAVVERRFNDDMNPAVTYPLVTPPTVETKLEVKVLLNHPM